MIALIAPPRVRPRVPANPRREATPWALRTLGTFAPIPTTWGAGRSRRFGESARLDRRGSLLVAAEPARMPDQPERRAEERSEHQRERHRDHVQRLVAPARRT